MSFFDDTEVISSYPLKQAIEDGILVEIFKKRWKELSGGRPIVATAHIFEEVSLEGLLEIWNEFAVWRRDAWIQLANATFDLKAAISSAMVSAGVFHPRV